MNEGDDQNLKVPDGQSGPARTGTPSSGAKPRKPSEPSSFPVFNMSRVTPLQQSLLSFPDSSRFIPVRPFAASADLQIKGQKKGSSGVTGGRKDVGHRNGSIIVLRDTQAEKEDKESKEGEYIELDKTLWPRTPLPGDPNWVPPRDQQDEQAREPEQRTSGELTSGEAPIPAPFEYQF